MPWCPKCRVEYRAGFSVCGDCGEHLVDELPPLPEAEEKAEEEISFDSSVHLMTVYDQAQANVIESLLHAHSIGTRRQYKGPGHYLKVFYGMSSFGIDIFVLSHDLNRAKELLESPFKEEETVVDDKDNSTPTHSITGKQSVGRWLIIAYLLIALSAVILFVLLD